MQENKHLHNVEESSIDVVAILKMFWLGRKLIFRITFFLTLLGVFVAVFSRNEYTASTTFVPLVQGKSSSGLLASLAGINLGGGVKSTEISPSLYPKILTSYPYQKELFETALTIKGENEPISYKKYYKDVYSPGVLGYIKKYTIGLPSILVSLFKSDTKKNIEYKVVDYSPILEIPKNESILIDLLSKQLELDVNDKEGFISISATMEEPLASAQLALKAQEVLQKFALHFKTKKSIEELNFIKARYLEKQKEFNTMKINLARFQDRNIGINTALGNTKLLKLKSDYNLVFGVYSELAKQVESHLLQVKKDTPLFTVLKPVTIPSRKSNSSKIVIVFSYFFIGLILSLMYVLLRKNFLQLKAKWLLSKQS
jgi:hypothetical protein